MTTSSIRLLGSALALGAFLSASGEAHAGPKDEAKLHSRKAQKAYQVGKFAEAIGEYTQAYDLSGMPIFLFNIGQCYRQLADPEQAAFFYGRYLSAAEQPIPHEEMVRELLAEAQAQLEAQKAQMAPPPPPPAAQPQLSAPPAAVAVERAPPPAKPASRPITKRWWFWAGIGAVAAAGATAATLALLPERPPQASLGDIHF